ncbi:FtsX-like permease family protein, partial [Actinacidiphila glaucinigra]|uniref:FtsX-like permease family protein n=1 Tax=Actinacidiphila glaucinigra TaxID=235986 RepID=UPI0035DFDB0B
MAEPRTPRSGDVSWIRARLLRAAPGGTLALAALVLVTAFLAAALPRAVDGYENSALRDTVAHTSVPDRSVTMSLQVSRLSVPFDPEALLTSTSLKETEKEFQKLVRPPLALERDQTVYGVRSVETVAADPGLPRFPADTPLPPKGTLVAQPDLAGNTRLVEGRLPHPRADDRSVEAVITDRTAKAMKLRTGSAFHLQDPLGSVMTVRVTGIVTPRTPGAAWWNAESDLRGPSMRSQPGSGGDPVRYWHFTALIDESATNVLLGLQDGAQAYWHHPADIGALTARDVPALRDRLSALTAGPAAARLQTKQRGLHVEEDGLAERLGPFVAERTAAQPLILVAAVGVGTVAVVVLLMAAGLSANRRRAEFTLLRARGISMSALTGRLLAESAVVAVPSAAAGLALALFLLPTERASLAVWSATAVAVLATVSLPLRAAATARRPRPGQREDIVAARPSRRRTVAELAVVLVVTGAVVALRQRGTADGGADILTAAAPVLLAVVTALVLLRLYPWPVRLLARPFARLNGAVLHLGLARAGRAPSTTALPLLAVLVALTVTSFGGAVLAGVDAGRDQAAVTAVGADARVQTFGALPQGLDTQVRKVPGVREVTGVRIEPGQQIINSRTRFDLLVVDPEPYARLVAADGLGTSFPAGKLDSATKEPIPAIASPAVARTFGNGVGDPETVRSSVGRVMVRIVGTQDATPAAPNHEFLIVSRAALAKVAPGTKEPAHGPSTLYATGTGIDATALRAAVAKAAPEAQVTLRTEQRASYGTTSALQSGARHVYLAAVAAGAGYSVLALLLSLLHNAPQRKALLARLRTMGMTGRGRQWLAVLEMLPQVLLGALGGILVSVATVPLVRPGVDLAALAFTVRTPATDLSGAVLHTDAASLLVPATALVVLACVVLAVQAWLTGRRGEGTELRMGER